MVSRPFTPGDASDGLVFDMIGDAAPDAAVGADGIHRGRGCEIADDRQCFIGQGACGAIGHAFAAGHAGGLAHRLVHVETDSRQEALAIAPDDLIHLDVVASPNATVAQNAGGVIDGDDGGGNILTLGRGTPGKTGLTQPITACQALQLAGPELPLARAGRGVIGHEQFDQHAARTFDAL
jgi:hypothetical protein